MSGGDEQPTETTALLATSQSVQGPQILPPVFPTLSRLWDKDPQFLHSPDLCPHTLPSRAAETAYTLIVLLQLRTTGRGKPFSSPRDIWEQWSQHKNFSDNSDHLDRMVLAVWSEFLHEYQSPHDIEDVLWLAFPFKEGSRRSLRVVDSLSHSQSPPALLSHPAIQLALMRTWKYGHLVKPQSGIYMSTRALQLYDSLCTPRVAHAIDLVYDLVFLGLLAHFILYPPRKPIIINGLTSYGSREVFLVFLSLSSLVRPWSIFTSPFLLVFVSFLASLPFSPFPGDIGFYVLLFSLVVLLFQLHLPRPPSPLFIFSVDHTLPLSTFLSASSGIFSTVVLFFLPVLLLTFYMLSISLADTTIPVLHAVATDAAPMETRTALLAFLVAEAAAFLWSLFILATSFAFLLSTSSSTEAWDQYSKTVGMDARRIFIRCVAAYANPYYFPLPFGLIQFIFVSLPSAFLYLAGKSNASRYLNNVAKLLWRVTVGPVALVVGGLWLWGLGC